MNYLKIEYVNYAMPYKSPQWKHNKILTLRSGGLIISILSHACVGVHPLGCLILNPIRYSISVRCVLRSTLLSICIAIATSTRRVIGSAVR